MLGYSCQQLDVFLSKYCYPFSGDRGEVLEVGVESMSVKECSFCICAHH